MLIVVSPVQALTDVGHTTEFPILHDNIAFQRNNPQDYNTSVAFQAQAKFNLFMRSKYSLMDN